MGDKFKPRQTRKPRNAIVEDMNRFAKGGPMRDRKERRPKDARNFQLDDEDFEDDSSVPKA